MLLSVLQALVQVWLDAICIVNAGGLLPLHHACMEVKNTIAYQKLQFLLETWPEKPLQLRQLCLHWVLFPSHTSTKVILLLAYIVVSTGYACARFTGMFDFTCTYTLGPFCLETLLFLTKTPESVQVPVDMAISGAWMCQLSCHHDLCSLSLCTHDWGILPFHLHAHGSASLALSWSTIALIMLTFFACVFSEDDQVYFVMACNPLTVCAMM